MDDDIRKTFHSSMNALMKVAPDRFRPTQIEVDFVNCLVKNFFRGQDTIHVSCLPKTSVE